MTTYLLIETCSTWENQGVRDFLDIALGLAKHDTRVDLWLVQNGVIIACEGVEHRIRELVGMPGVNVWVDDFSMIARAVMGKDIVQGVQIAAMDRFVALLTAPGCKPIWH